MLFNNLKLKEHGDSKDILGRTYEYAISQFASLEGKNAGELHTCRNCSYTCRDIRAL